MHYRWRMASDKVTELIAVAKTLTLAQRRKLVIELEALVARDVAGHSGTDSLGALRALAGSVRSECDAAASGESDGWGVHQVAST